jgi:DNA-binding winged helix-turn-helix (wHTH) protein
MASRASYRFGAFLLDATAFRLVRGGDPIALTPKLLDVLHYLVARPGELVTKEALFASVWPDVTVTDNALTQAISELRQALGDDPSSPRYIQTVARRGYRFIGEVEVVGDAARVGLAPAAGGAPAAAAHERTIVVQEFVNVTGDPEYAWLSSGIAETVTSDLGAIEGLRVIDRARAAGVSAAALGVDLTVVGSFQRAGDRLRMTARVVRTATGEAVAEAKVDGALADVFSLQDRLVASFAGSLGLTGARGRRASGRETSSLEAYRALNEGRIKLETLDPALIAAAREDFERAAALDPRYPAAHVGVANTRFCEFELSRARNRPDAGLLAAAVDHAKRAIELDRDYAEAHATLSFLLVSARRADEALAAARRAVALEPGSWEHHFRHGHAAWGEERLQALSRALALYPEFAFAHFEMAMVLIARGHLDRAEQALREGTIIQDRQTGRRERFPARGLHWLLGLVRLALGDVAEATTEFERELTGGGSQLYAVEFAMNAFDGLGFARLASDDPEGAQVMFRRALELYPGHARSHAGLAVALSRGGREEDAAAERGRARDAARDLEHGGRVTEARLALAFERIAAGAGDGACAPLESAIDAGGPLFAGWTIRIEPMLAPIRGTARFQAVLDRLAARAAT